MQSDVESDADEGGGASASEDEEVARRWQEGSAAGNLEIPVPDFGLGVRLSQPQAVCLVTSTSWRGHPMPLQVNFVTLTCWCQWRCSPQLGRGR